MVAEYRLKGTLTFEEYLECHKILAAKRRISLRGVVILGGALFLLLGVLGRGEESGSTRVILGAIFLFYGAVLSPILFRFRVKRNWNQYPRIRDEFDITIQLDGVQSIDDKGNPTHTAWDSFIRFRESKSLFLLYLSPFLPICLPKRLVMEEELDGLRTVLESSIE